MSQVELSASDRLQATRLAGRIDQIIGWAKAGKNEEYYAMDIENVDRMRNDIINVIVAELGADDAHLQALREIALSGAAKTERGEGR